MAAHRTHRAHFTHHRKGFISLQLQLCVAAPALPLLLRKSSIGNACTCTLLHKQKYPMYDKSFLEMITALECVNPTLEIPKSAIKSSPREWTISTFHTQEDWPTSRYCSMNLRQLLVNRFQ